MILLVWDFASTFIFFCNFFTTFWWKCNAIFQSVTGLRFISRTSVDSARYKSEKVFLMFGWDMSLKSFSILGWDTYLIFFLSSILGRDICIESTLMTVHLHCIFCCSFGQPLMKMQLHIFEYVTQYCERSLLVQCT